MFTIAIPIYKYKEEFKKVLNSIKKIDQKLINEILCFIQPSGDEEKIIQIIRESELKIKYEVNEINIGMVANWNKCIKNSSSKYLIINHDDDYLLPNILKEYNKIFKNHPEVGLVSCKQIYSNNCIFKKIIKITHNHILKRINYYDKNDIKRYVFNDFTLPCSGVAFNIEVLGAEFLFSDKYPYSSDEELWPRILNSHPIIIIKKFLLVRNISKASTNYEFETWYKDDFIKQYVDIRKVIISYCNSDEEVIDYFKKGLIPIFERIEEHTHNKIDKDFYLNEYLSKFD